MNLERRVVVTGVGVCTPLGRDIYTLWKNLVDGQTSIRDVTDTHPYMRNFKVRIGSFFPHFEIDCDKTGIDFKTARRMCENSAIALEATDEALRMSGILDIKNYGENMGVSIGAGYGGLKAIEEAVLKSKEDGMARVDKMIAAKSLPASAASTIALRFGLHGPNYGSVSACASGADNIIRAYSAIKMNDCDIMLGGGSGEISSLIPSGFGNLGALSTRNDEPGKASRPFDRDRDGFVIGEGAGVLVLEELEHAKERNAPILAELLSYAGNSDAYHLTAPREDGIYAVKAMREAIRRAGINPFDIDYVNTHGTSTPHNDRIESMVLREVFGDYAGRLVEENSKVVNKSRKNSSYFNSTKSMIGHTLNASAAIEAAVTVWSMKKGLIHPTRNLEHPDFSNGCDLNYVMKDAVSREINYALSDAFAFGGRNVFLVFGKYNGK